MRTTWDAAATSERRDEYVGDPATARTELEGLFGRLGDDPHGGVCVEVGCGPGRMTGALAERFDRVLAVDVSPAMLDLARQNVDILEMLHEKTRGNLTHEETELLEQVVPQLQLLYVKKAR